MSTNAWLPPEAPLGGPVVVGDAPLGRRLLAAIIDRAMFYLPATPAILWAAWNEWKATHVVGIAPFDQPPLMPWPLALIGYAGMAGVVVWQWNGIRKFGQTPGKQWMGIRIVRIDGVPIDFLYGVVLRNGVVALAIALCNSPVLVGLFNLSILGWIVRGIDVLPIFRADRQCVHDYIVGTRVVTVPVEER